ncbi:hypothetical protein [Deinococcus cellulosilyticus]|uniref:Uncharacterized protein n=1 Tax=Deinococcus cellulosilyticus (strain DSM 18568 / NBRC 106333 / KACC 11606 / 5516J-15) TaxID=1223518 RepID=A0A511MYR9_DEIC1|nr:hypothetical protein [Deinococcus cellulosilyticus]GEM45745.1 hypothetical protein DC3_13800 [Deinococcus cellulosilyticus NBRC 106333 = KACC 11606]
MKHLRNWVLSAAVLLSTSALATPATSIFKSYQTVFAEAGKQLPEAELWEGGFTYFDESGEEWSWDYDDPNLTVEGEHLVIVAFGDGEVLTDMDLVVTDAAGNVLGKDADEDNYAIVDFKAPGGTITITMKAFETKRANEGYGGYMIFRLPN